MRTAYAVDRPHKLSHRDGNRVAPLSQKKTVNVSINRELLNRARSADLKLSSILEAALEQRLRQQARERWLTENRAGIEAYNEQVERDGVFSDGLRAF
jgi:antitoxin CcdA